MADRIPVIEIFGPTIQGEGALLGFPTHFLRTGGCGYNCIWCDSMHAVDPAQVKANRTMMTIDEIVHRIDSLPKAPWLTLTGGDPCLHKKLGDIVPHMWNRGIKVCVETQGQVWPEWLRSIDVVTFSPKGPSAGNVTSIETFRDRLAGFRHHSRGVLVVKVVVFDEQDLEYSTDLYNQLHPRVGGPLYDKFYFQVGSPLLSDIPQLDFDENANLGQLDKDAILRSHDSVYLRTQILDSYAMLVERLLERVEELDANTAITPQMHTLIWPTEQRGR